MNIEQLREYCLKKKGVNESFPFNEETLVFKVITKIFLLASLDSIPLSINLKCDPELAVELRERHQSIQPGYHMNKTHWNTIIIDGTLLDKKLYDLIDHSYELVKGGLKKSDLKQLES